MKKLYKERLLQVVRVLEELPKEKRFNLERWHICGTEACAVGWAAADPWFKRRGLRLQKDGGIDDGKQWYEPVYQIHTAMTAAQQFFNLTNHEGSHLFSPNNYVKGRKSRRDVIRRIKQFVREAA